MEREAWEYFEKHRRQLFAIEFPDNEMTPVYE